MFLDSSETLTIKLLILGDLSVGKSSFIYRFIDDKFDENMTTTDLDLKTADLIIEDKNIRVQLWDTAGQEKYRSISKNLISRVQGILILYDTLSFSEVKVPKTNSLGKILTLDLLFFKNIEKSLGTSN